MSHSAIGCSYMVHIKHTERIVQATIVGVKVYV